MIFGAAGPIFQAKSVLNRDHDSASRCQMAGNASEHFHIRLCCPDIALGIFKHTDQGNVIIFLSKTTLHILKISYHNFHIIAFAISICIDGAAHFRQIDTGDTFGFSRENSCDRSTAGPDFQNFLFFCDRKPLQNILANM